VGAREQDCNGVIHGKRSLEAKRLPLLVCIAKGACRVSRQQLQQCKASDVERHRCVAKDTARFEACSTRRLCGTAADPERGQMCDIRRKLQQAKQEVPNLLQQEHESSSKG